MTEQVTREELNSRLADYPTRSEVEGMIQLAVSQQETHLAGVMRDVRASVDGYLSEQQKMRQMVSRDMDEIKKLVKNANRRALQAQHKAEAADDKADQAAAGFEVLKEMFTGVKADLATHFDKGVEDLKKTIERHEADIKRWRSMENVIVIGFNFLSGLPFLKLMKRVVGLVLAVGGAAGVGWLLFTFALR